MGGWLLFLDKGLYPILNDGVGPAALGRYQHLGDGVGDILRNALFSPGEFLGALDWAKIIFYLLLLSLPLACYWRRSSFPLLAATLPLLAASVLSSSSAQQGLIHQYSLPLAVLLVVASMDGLTADLRQRPSLADAVALVLLLLGNPVLGTFGQARLFLWSLSIQGGSIFTSASFHKAHSH